MRKKRSIFTSIILTICLLIAAPFNAYAAELSIGVNTVSSSSADSDPANGKCAKLEGMAVGTKYIYTAKRSDDKKYVSIYRTKMSTGETVLLQFTNESNPNYSSKLGYAGDMQVIDINGQTTLMVATGTSIVQVKVDNPNKQLTVQKVYKLNNVQYITSIASDKENNGVFYIRTKKNDDSSGFAIYKVTIELSKTSSTKTLPLDGKKVCKLVKIAEQCSGQGMAYYNGKLYIGMTTTHTDSSGNEYKQNCISIYKIPSNYEEVEVQNKIKLNQTGEIEGVDITGGYLYYSQKGGTTGSNPYTVYVSQNPISK
jgi:hypothetical protein